MAEKLSINNLRGKWVIIIDEQIIASSDKVKTVINKAREKYPSKKLILAKVPEKGTLIY